MAGAQIDWATLTCEVRFGVSALELVVENLVTPFLLSLFSWTSLWVWC